MSDRYSQQRRRIHGHIMTRAMAASLERMARSDTLERSLQVGPALARRGWASEEAAARMPTYPHHSGYRITEAGILALAVYLSEWFNEAQMVALIADCQRTWQSAKLRKLSIKAVIPTP